MKKLLVTLSLLWGAGATVAQQQPRMLSIDEAMTLALDRNPQMEADRYQRLAAESERKAAFGLRLPQVDVLGSYVMTNRDMKIDINGLKGPANNLLNGLFGELGQAGIVVPPSITELASSLMGADWGMTLQKKRVGFVGGSLTLPVYAGGRINAANRAARINEQSAEKQGDQNRNALVSELVERYYGLALAMQVVEVRKQVVEGVRVHLQDAVALEKAGIIARSEKLYAEVKMAEAERELLDARLQVRTLTAALGNTLNSPVDFLPVSPMFVLERMEGVEYYRSVASANSPLLEQVALKRQLAEEGVKVQRAAYLPELALMGGGMFYRYQVTRMLPSWAIGAGMKINLFDGTQREHRYAAAKRTVQQVEALENKANSDISVLVEKIYNQMLNYHDQIPSIDASMEFASEYLRIKNAAFHEGMASSADVIDAQLELARIRTERLQAAFNYDLMLARLLEAAGVSDRFIEYVRRADARQITFDNSPSENKQ